MYLVHNLDDIKDSFFLSGRNVGASKKLCGNIAVISCLIKYDCLDFMPGTKDDYFNALHQALRWLEGQAKRYNVTLKLEGYHIDIDAPKNFDEDRSWTIIKDYFHSSTMESLQTKYETQFNLDETPFLAVFDKHGRSFAWMQRKALPYSVDELSVISRYKDNFDWRTIAHELLHQFGAVDLYYPQKIQQLADYHLGNSIMGESMQDLDDLTAYLIGWKDTISYDTYRFLKDTMWYTKSEFEKALAEVWKEEF